MSRRNGVFVVQVDDAPEEEEFGERKTTHKVDPRLEESARKRETKHRDTLVLTCSWATRKAWKTFAFSVGERKKRDPCYSGSEGDRPENEYVED